MLIYEDTENPETEDENRQITFSWKIVTTQTAREEVDIYSRQGERGLIEFGIEHQLEIEYLTWNELSH